MNSYSRYLNDLNDPTGKTKPDPWTDLANAIVAQAADDYRRLCKKMVERGATMEPVSFRILDGRIKEIEVFFKSDWGFLLSHGLAPVIWEKLKDEFAEDINQMEADRKAWIASEEKRIEDEAKARREAQHKEMVEAIFRDVFTEVYGEDGEED
jgi:hypothetical protein